MTIYLLAGGRLAELTIPVWFMTLTAGVVVGMLAKPLINGFKKYFLRW